MEVLNDDTFNCFIDYKRCLWNLYTEDVKALQETTRSYSFDYWKLRNIELVNRIFSRFARCLSGRSSEDVSRAFRVCNAIYQNNWQRSKRLRERIEKWAGIGCLYFVTLTFNDVTLEKTSENTRKDYVKRFLQGLDCFYVANIDYGDKHQREHYHSIICVPEDLPGQWVKSKTLFLRCPFFTPWEEKNGFYNIQKINLDDEKLDAVRIGRYLSKLTNHALKRSTHGARLMYNKKKPTWYKGD